MYRRKKNTYPKKATTKRKYTSKRKVTTKSVKRIVKTALSRNIENKTFSAYFSNQPVYPSVHPNFQSQINPCTPYNAYLDIQQGVGQGGRIGNQIKIKSLVMKYVLSPLQFDTTTNNQPRPTEVILWVFYDKQNPTTIPQIGNDFLQLGGSSLPLQNSLIDVTAPVNTDRYTVVYRRSHKIGYSAYNGTGTLPAFQSFTNNDYKLNVRGTVYLTKHAIKTVKYNDSNDSPMTRGLFYVFQAISANGGSYTSVQLPVNAAVTLDVKYEDA